MGTQDVIISQALHKFNRELKIRDLIMSVEGQISWPEAQLLMRLASEIPFTQKIVEIGTYRGRSAIALALASPSAVRVYAVDPHEDFEGIMGGSFSPDDLAALYRNLVRANVGHKVAVVALSSLEASKSWSQQNVGLLWIDGDHRYETVRSDFTSWYHWVVPGGYVAFHDSTFQDVKRLIREKNEAGQFEIQGEVGEIVWGLKRV